MSRFEGPELEGVLAVFGLKIMAPKRRADATEDDAEAKRHAASSLSSPSTATMRT